MSWLRGTIEVFKGGKPEHRELRKIRTSPTQGWDDLHYFHLSLARQAGYPEEALGDGCRIEFEPDGKSDRPRVARFKPYEPETPRPAPRPARTTEFLNPYHFLPLAAPPEESLRVWKSYRDEAPLHDRFGDASGEDPCYSGRIVCRLRAEGPVVVGAEQSQPGGDPEEATVVHPFELPDPEEPDRGRPAIPGSTLRGLVSAIVEAASSSALRVLPNRSFTRRAKIGRESPSAVAMVVEENGELRLRPLTWSIHEMTDTPNPPPDRCRVLLSGYQSRGGKQAPAPGSFLARRSPASWSSSHQEHWYANLAGARPHRRGRFVIGLDLPQDPIPESEWQGMSPSERAAYPDRGLLLVLGLDGSKAANLPRTKKHEYFLPYPPEREREPTLPIPPAVLADFESLARDSEALARGGESDDFPYLHAGRRRDRSGVELRPGDLVYYETDRSDAVSAITLSSIWRRRVAGDLYGSIALESPDLIPLHGGDDRKKLTLAERLFGFVENEGQRALAGRLRFSHALAEGAEPRDGWYEPELPLKILASPKPPSPALYFGNRGWLGTEALTLDKHVPQGRKVYLHHPKEAVERRSYETREPEEKRRLKTRVRPLREGTSLLFHVDFTNLTGEELGHLLYALRPTAAFRHKLGLGKPLGLGRVAIDPLVLAFLDRRSSYDPTGLFGPKYAAAESWVEAAAWDGLGETLARRYRHEKEAALRPAAASSPFPRREELVRAVRGRIPGRVRWALELVGDPASVESGAEVTYPVLRGQDAEGEHFRWFVENDRNQHKPLPAIEEGKPLPTLERYEPGKG